MLVRRSLLVAALAVLASIAGCADADTPSGAGGPAVVATTTQIADFARNVGGDRIGLAALLPPNSDPHDYEPTPGDAAAIADADVILEHGIGLDEWLDDLIANAGGDATRTVVTEGIAIRPGGTDEPDGDPHVWLDPQNAVSMVEGIAQALAAADPAGAAIYRANAARYVAELRALDDALEEQIGVVPRADRKIVTDHDAFGYFAARYGITVVGTVIPSFSTAAEPSPKEITELVETISAAGARAVFSEASVDPRLERAVAAEAGVTFGPSLYGDSLAPPGEPAGTYVGMMRVNMDAIVEGLTP